MYLQSNITYYVNARHISHNLNLNATHRVKMVYDVFVNIIHNKFITIPYSDVTKRKGAPRRILWKLSVVEQKLAFK